MNEEEKELEGLTNAGWIIPDCCLENWPDCPHVAQKEVKQEENTI